MDRVDANEVLERLARIGVVFHGNGLREAIAAASDWRKALIDAARWGRDEGVWLSLTTPDSPSHLAVAEVLAAVMEPAQVRAVVDYLAPPTEFDLADIVRDCALSGRPLYLAGEAAEFGALVRHVDEARRALGRPVTVIFTGVERAAACNGAAAATLTRH